MDDWKNPALAQRWDADPLTHNPTRPEMLDIILSLLEDEYREGDTILDIGMGSGLVEEMILARIPHARIVGVDSSPAMVELAHQKLRPYMGRYEEVMHDLCETGSLHLPEHEYGVVVSVQVIHNIEDEYKREVFSFIHRTLKSGGIFLLLDRVSIDTPNLFSLYKSLWQRLEGLHNAQMREGETFREHKERVSTRGDMPISLEQYLQWLREVGFEVACLHLHGNRALFAARKT